VCSRHSSLSCLLSGAALLMRSRPAIDLIFFMFLCTSGMPIRRTDCKETDLSSDDTLFGGKTRTGQKPTDRHRMLDSACGAAYHPDSQPRSYHIVGRRLSSRQSGVQTFRHMPGRAGDETNGARGANVRGRDPGQSAAILHRTGGGGGLARTYRAEASGGSGEDSGGDQQGC
jgi:hypothetical protein